MSQPVIQLHPDDRRLLEKVWRKSARQAGATRRRYYPRRPTRRRHDLLTITVDGLFAGLVWLLSKLIASLLLALEWLLWQLAGLILSLFTLSGGLLRKVWRNPLAGSQTLNKARQLYPSLLRFL